MGEVVATSANELVEQGDGISNQLTEAQVMRRIGQLARNNIKIALMHNNLRASSPMEKEDKQRIVEKYKKLLARSERIRKGLDLALRSQIGTLINIETATGEVQLSRWPNIWEEDGEGKIIAVPHSKFTGKYGRVDPAGDLVLADLEERRWKFTIHDGRKPLAKLTFSDTTKN